jgi:NTP pyrophosphatase (non-canonical NTP hydrolase)
VGDFKEYQEAAASTAVYPDLGSNLYYPALGLAGEAGELCNKVKKIMRDDDGRLTEESRAVISKEIGDVLWYVAAMCSEAGLSLEVVASENIEKLKGRKERGTLQGSGDNR